MDGAVLRGRSPFGKAASPPRRKRESGLMNISSLLFSSLLFFLRRPGLHLKVPPPSRGRCFSCSAHRCLYGLCPSCLQEGSYLFLPRFYTLFLPSEIVSQNGVCAGCCGGKERGSLFSGLYSLLRAGRGRSVLPPAVGGGFREKRGGARQRRCGGCLSVGLH